VSDEPNTVSSADPATAEAAPPSRRTPDGSDASQSSGAVRIEHTIDDISAVEDLIRYVVAAQLSRLDALDISQATVAKIMSISPQNLSHMLAGRQKFPIPTLHYLDKGSVALAPQLDHTAAVAQFGVRMRDLIDRESLVALVPPSYFIGTSARSEDELHVMAQAADILDKFMTVEKASRSIAGIRNHYARQIKEIAERLILISGAPPTPRNVEAQILLGSLAKYAFDIIIDQLEDSLRHSPLGFRVWRALTKMVLLSQAEQDGNARQLGAQLQPRLASLLAEANEMRKNSLYPGRSLDLELATAVPLRWLRPNTSVTRVLSQRAMSQAATLRERATAAHGLWQRAMHAGRVDHPDEARRMSGLIAHFRDAQQERPDIANGLEWAATTLDYVFQQRVAVCNDWHTVKVDQPWFDAVQDSARLLDQEDIPSWVRSGTRKLFEHILLQNAGVERRKAIDTVAAGGYVEPVARALSRVLRDSRAESWLRIRAIFALGFLQHRSATTVRSLTSACREACQAVLSADDPTTSLINELHTALFAIGDGFGAVGAEDDARIVRDTLSKELQRLVDNQRLQDQRMYPVARALVYLLTFTAQPRGRSDQEDLSQQLIKALESHSDHVTRDFSTWALRYRFSDTGDIHPILHAATT
jgi:hypothetical protein